MATFLGTSFSSDEKIVSQTDTQTLGSFAKTLVIEFDQAKFEESISKNEISSTASSFRRIHRRANIRSNATSAYVNTTLAEEGSSLFKSQTNFAKGEGSLTFSLIEDQDVNTSDLGLQPPMTSAPHKNQDVNTFDLGLQLSIPSGACYASSLEAENEGSLSSKFPKRNKTPGQCHRKRRRRSTN